MNEWIDVNVRMPEEDDEILVVVDDGCGISVWTNVIYSSKQGKWLWAAEAINDRWEPVIGVVTHWMLLPEPPKIVPTDFIMSRFQKVT